MTGTTNPPRPSLLPPPELERRVRGAVRSEPAPARTAPRVPLAVQIVLALAAMALLVALWPEGFSHADGRPADTGQWIVVGTGVIALLATWLALPSRRSMLSPARGRLLAVVLGVPLLVGAWMLFWHPTYDDPFVRVGFRCFGLTAASAPFAFLVLLGVSRRFDPRHPVITGAALGAAAGAWAAVSAVLWCPLTEPSHVAIGHVAPLLALAAAGAVFGALRFALRRK